MVQRKPTGPAKRLVWRISEAAPLGEFVDPNAAPPAQAPAPPGESERPGGWVLSSFELKHGVDVREGDDTVPGELFDELFAPPAAPPKPRDPG